VLVLVEIIEVQSMKALCDSSTAAGVHMHLLVFNKSGRETCEG
jgi:hypothetical protein